MSKKLILFLTPDEQFRAKFRQHLTDIGYEVYTSDNALCAVTRLVAANLQPTRTRLVNLIVTEMAMPDVEVNPHSPGTQLLASLSSNIDFRTEMVVLIPEGAEIREAWRREPEEPRRHFLHKTDDLLVQLDALVRKILPLQQW